MLDKSILIDYLTVTFTIDKKTEEGRELLLKGHELPQLDLILEAFRLNDVYNQGLFELRGGMLGYSKSYHYNGCVVCEPLETRKDMGYCFSFSGNGCRCLERFSDFNWIVLFKHLFKLNNIGYKVNFTRIDLAVDDFDNKLNMPKIIDYSKKGLFSSISRKNNIVRSFDTIDTNGNNLGSTIYYGSKSSERYIRIYDKLAEQKSKGIIVDENINHWVRLECVFKKQFALQMILAYIELEDNFGSFFADVVNGQLRFLEERNANISRSKTAVWWSKFVKTVNTFKLTKGEKCIKSIDKMARYLNDKVAPTLVTVLAVYGKKYLDSLINIGSDKINDRHIYAVKTADSYDNNEVLSVNKDIIQRAKDNLLMRGFEQYAIQEA